MYYGNKNLAVDGNLMVADGESFPSTSVVGFLTAGQINIGNSAQAKMMGLFYAQDQITVSKQTQLAGIVITDEFSVGNQVPDFFQVPGLDQSAPAGVRGDLWWQRETSHWWVEAGVLKVKIELKKQNRGHCLPPFFLIVGKSFFKKVHLNSKKRKLVFRPQCNIRRFPNFRSHHIA